MIDQIEGWQKKLYPRFGLHFIHASDEWYILAGRDFPEEERYDGYLQLENGVGMLRLLFTEVRESLEQLTDVPDEPREISIATGRLAGPYLTRILEEIQEQFPSLRYHVYEIRNDFFGELITVSGLITGIDLMQQLSKVPLGDELLLPCSMLKSDEQIFLDDYSLAQVQEALKTPIRIVESDGAAFVRAVLGLP